MDFDDLLACPSCDGALTARWSCSGCGTSFDAPDGIPSLRVRGDRRTEQVRDFYTCAPFPGYAPNDNVERLRARAERSEFARLLDRAIPPDATVLDFGCGTGQMSLYLARGERRVIGADLTRASLQLGAAAAQRFGLDSRVRFVETDLQRPALRKHAFDVVYSSGVLHHTPDPRASFARLAPLARPGGTIILGLYNAVARIPLRLRRAVARASRYRFIPFDPVLRDRAHEPARREAWLRDQYQHPEEHRHTVGEVRAWFEENGIEYLRTFPSSLLATDSDDLFAPAGDHWSFEEWLVQLGWMHTLGHEGGLFMTIGRAG